MRCRTELILAVPLVLALGCSNAVGPTSSTATSSVTGDEALGALGDERTATLWVKGLACPYCVHNVDRQLASLPGVDRVHVDLPTGKVTVTLARDHPATREQLAQAIADSGFTLERIEIGE